MEVNQIICGAMPEATKVFPDETFNCSISSPPYWALRDYSIPLSVWDGERIVSINGAKVKYLSLRDSIMETIQEAH